MKTTLPRRMLSLLLCIALCVGLLPTVSFAEDANSADLDEASEITAEETVPAEDTEDLLLYSSDGVDLGQTVTETTALEELEEAIRNQAAEAAVNGDGVMEPVILDIDPESVEILPEEQVTNDAALDSAAIYTDPAELGAYLKQKLLAHEPEITYSYQVPAADYGTEAANFRSSAYNTAYAHTGKSTEGDYLRYSTLGITCTSSTGYYTSDGTKVVFTNTYAISYRITAEQEAELAETVDQVFTELDIDNLQSDYEKIKAIYIWMCANIEYDYENLNDETYKLKYTAYAGAVNHTCVCMGFALLFYYMSLKAGVDARYLTGQTSGGYHAWNIVKMGNVYYNLDSTWDEGYDDDFESYIWFLKNEEDFPDHIRDDDYATDEFYAAYPMSATSYAELLDSGTCGENMKWAYYFGGLLKITGSGSMYSYSTDVPAPWDSHRTEIKTVNIEEGITGIGSYAFYYCNMTSLSLPESLTAIGNNAFDFCRCLTGVTIPANVTSIGDYAFNFCYRLTEFKVAVKNKAYTAVDGVLFNKARTTLIQYPIGNTATSYEIPATVTCVGDKALYYAHNLTSVTIPDSVRSLGVQAFYGSALTEVTVPYSVTSIYNFAFGCCSSLTSVKFKGKAPETTGYGLFYLDTLTAYYPSGDSSWSGKMTDYAGTSVDWEAYGPEGDCNGDGTVGSSDLTLLAKALATDNYQNIDSAAADLSGGGTVNLMDLLILKRQLADAA